MFRLFKKTKNIDSFIELFDDKFEKYFEGKEEELR